MGRHDDASDGCGPRPRGIAGCRRTSYFAKKRCIDGFGGNDTISGLKGDDILIGGDGNDSIDAGLGSNRIFGDAGDDVITSSGSDTVDAGAGNNTIVISGTATGGTYTSGSGNDSYTINCLLYTSPSPRDVEESRMPSSA